MRAAVKRSEQLAREVSAWQAKLAPRLPDIEPHDLNLILWSILRRKHGGRLQVLMPRPRK